MTEVIRLLGDTPTFGLGQVVWRRRLSRDPNRQRYPGVDLTVRRARNWWLCSDCDSEIQKGDPHGSGIYEHYCLDCCTGTKP